MNIMQVKVTNRNPFTVEDRYDGILYTFNPDVPVNLPYDAAAHIFGADFTPGPTGHIDPSLREKAFVHVSRRWGWNSPKMAEKARAKFDKFEFGVVKIEMVETSVGEQELPAPKKAKKEVA